MTSIQSLKSAVTTRVDPTTALRLFSESRNLGNPATCPLGATEIDVDEWGRPQGGARHRLLKLNVPECSGKLYPVSRMLAHENATRPILGPCSHGDRGAGDFMYGSVRDRFPKNLYGEGTRGDFVSPFTSFKPDEGIPEYTTNYLPSTKRQLTLSHDALIKPYFG